MVRSLSLSVMYKCGMSQKGNLASKPWHSGTTLNSMVTTLLPVFEHTSGKCWMGPLFSHTHCWLYSNVPFVPELQKTEPLELSPSVSHLSLIAQTEHSSLLAYRWK